MVALTARNLVYEAALQTDDLLTCVRNRRLANEALGQAQSADPGHAYSKDYARGFKDGFADYLDTGGCGAPPPLPARSYWLSHYWTLSGHEGVRDWFAGFRHGAAAAQETGHRGRRTVPSPAPGPEIPHPPPPNGFPPFPGGEPVLPFPTQMLPAPGGPGPTARPSAGGKGAG